MLIVRYFGVILYPMSLLTKCLLPCLYGRLNLLWSVKWNTGYKHRSSSFFAVLMSSQNILHYPTYASGSVFRACDCETQSPGGKLVLQIYTALLCQSCIVRSVFRTCETQSPGGKLVLQIYTTLPCQSCNIRSVFRTCEAQSQESWCCSEKGWYTTLPCQSSMFFYRWLFHTK